MQPTTQQRAIRTSAGMETPNQTLERARRLSQSLPTVNLANSQTPRRLGNVDVPSTVPSTALQGDRTMADVMTTRANLEQEANARQQFDTDFNALTGRIQNTTPSSPFVNPEQFLNRLLLRGRTDTQEQLDTQRQTQAETIRGFADEFTRTADQARQDLGVPQLQANLAETRTRIAERTNNLRQTLRDFEVNAERRGVAREFVQSERQAVQAQAAEELADLSIIESAQLGNLNEARAEIDTILAEKRQAFDFENAAIEAEIARLESIDTRESQARSEQLQIALQERTRLIETQLANERETRTFMAQAAANGADSGTLAAIRNAQTPGEALLLAGPWIGRLERMQAQANIANIYDQINARQVALREAAMNASTESEKVQKEKEASTEQALGIKTLAEELRNSPGKSAAVGFGFKKSVVGALPFVSGDAISGTARADFEAKANRLSNLLTLDNLKLMSGVLTDRDIQLLATAGSNLSQLNMSEAAYEAEINRVIQTMNRTINNNGITPEQASFYNVLPQEDIETFNSLWETL